jgi:CheY-like chemotaxis protein
MSIIRPIQGTARRLVLVADDEPAILAIVAHVLVDLDLVPVLVGNGVAAIAAVEAHQSELVYAILDIAMPGANGVDAAHVIQRLAPNLPIMLMTGAAPAASAGRIASLRLTGILLKPFQLIALRELLLPAVGDGGSREKRMAIGET